MVDSFYTFSGQGFGTPQGTSIIANRIPNSNDRVSPDGTPYQIGQTWQDKSTGNVYFYNGSYGWNLIYPTSPSPFPATNATGSIQMVVNHTYVVTGATTFTLPATASLGDIIYIASIPGSGGWTISQNDGQSIYLLDSSSTVGTMGGANSNPAGDFASPTLVCIVGGSSTTWTFNMGNTQELQIT